MEIDKNLKKLDWACLRFQVRFPLYLEKDRLLSISDCDLLSLREITRYSSTCRNLEELRGTKS